MSSSSLRNAVQRRNHKERTQLAHRSRLGLLEKHKDYVLRARDYHAKQDRINRLRVKASERNKDEFYFAMNRSKTEGGVHVQDRGNRALPPDIVKVLKTQDANYIRFQRAANRKRIELLKSQLTVLSDLLTPSSSSRSTVLHSLTEEEVTTLRTAGLLPAQEGARSKKGKGKLIGRSAPRHVVFAENAEEAASSYRPASPTALAKRVSIGDDDDDDGLPPITEKSDIDLEELGWVVPQSSKQGKHRVMQEQPAEPATDVVDQVDENGLSPKEYRSALITELSARMVRDTQLKYALQELELQKLLMGKGGRKKLREAEEVRDGDDKKKDDDEDDVMDGRGAKDEKAYKPRVFKWRLVRRK